MPSVLVRASLVSIALACFLWGSAAAASPSLRVDFSKRQYPASPIGFLHGMDAQEPHSDWVTPLHPALWRSGERTQLAARARSFGARYTYVVSDGWGYPGEGISPPHENYNAWRDFIRNKLQTRPFEEAASTIWDIWNEPDLRYFWNGTPEQFYETYRIAWQEIHAYLGDRALVAGPSVAHFSPEWIQGLLEYCLEHTCEVNILNWHELGPTGSIPGIEQHAKSMREQYIDNPRYRPLDIRELHVNEIIGSEDQYSPAATLAAFHYAEQGQVDAAARACWNDASGPSNCDNHTLDGLLTPFFRQPRATWWTTRAYADGMKKRVLTRASDPYVVGVASRSSEQPGSAQLMVGNLSRRADAPEATQVTDVKITLRRLRQLHFLRGERRVRIQVQGFPALGAAPLLRPQSRRSNIRVIGRQGAVRLTLHHVGVNEAYRLVFSKP